MLTNLASIISIRHSSKSEKQVVKLASPLVNLQLVNQLARLNCFLTVQFRWFNKLESRFPGKQLTRIVI